MSLRESDRLCSQPLRCPQQGFQIGNVLRVHQVEGLVLENVLQEVWLFLHFDLKEIELVSHFIKIISGFRLQSNNIAK